MTEELDGFRPPLESLEEFRPSPETIMEVKRQLLKAGELAENIPVPWVNITIAAMSKWLRTPNGMRFLANLLEFEFSKGDDTYDYFIDFDGSSQNEVPYEAEDITFIRGTLVRGVPISEEQVSEYVREENNCRGCGVRTHCVGAVTWSTNAEESELCNYCLQHSDNPRVRDQTDHGRCEDRCRLTTCSHHPSKRR